LGDVVGVQDPSLHRPLRDAMEFIAKHDHGVVVLLRHEESGRDLMAAVKSLGEEAASFGLRSPRAMDLRTFGTGAQVLRALGVKRMRVLSAPKHMHALSGFGLEVVEYLSPEAAPAVEQGSGDARAARSDGTDHGNG
jgi:3,4-dihydroxy 2-butanone 4-phosphate synthase/GTP cyclohydrolase II